MAAIVFKAESYALQGCIFEVYREMGCGFLGLCIRGTTNQA